MELNKKGFYFLMDAVFAAIIITLTLILYSQIGAQSTERLQTQTFSQDVLLSLENIQLKDLETQYPWLQDIYNSTDLNENDSLMYGMGFLWVLNDSRVQNLSQVITNIVPDRMSVKLTVEGETIYSKEGDSTNKSISAAQQQITGIDKGKPIAGTSTSAYLKRARDKETVSLTYLGGFTGQGSITMNVPLASDTNDSRVQSITLEIDTPEQFSAFMNGNACGAYTPTTQNKSADLFNLSGCIPHIIPDNNSFQLTFTELSFAYASGGLLKIVYTTDAIGQSRDYTKSRYEFAEVDGAINLYDGFIVPQTLTSMKAYIHYRNDNPKATTYFSIAEKSVYSSNKTGEVSFVLDDANFTFLGIDYNQLSNNTIPIRLTSLDDIIGQVNGSNADIVVITDMSGSMKKAIWNWDTGDAGQTCEEAFTDSTTRRASLANCLNMVLAGNLSVPGNRIWPVFLHKDKVEWYNNPTDFEAVVGEFSSWESKQANGKTCYACGINHAYDIFDTYSDGSRKKFVIFLTDGVPTHWADNNNQSTSIDYGDKQCEGLCDVTGSCDESNIPGQCMQCVANQGGVQNAVYSTKRLENDFDITMFTIGFGPVDDCSLAGTVLQQLADITNGTYHHSNDSSELSVIFDNITNSIINSVTWSSQIAVIPGNASSSKVFGDSYIELVHDEIIQPAGQNEIRITRQSDPFYGCSFTETIPVGVVLEEMIITSYSGPHWTDLITLNSQTIYNLSDYNVGYDRLGDPFRVNIPISMATTDNTFTINIGDNPTNSSGCSDNNTVIWSGRVKSATSRTPPLELAEGCTWDVEDETGATHTLGIPDGYVGPNICSFTNATGAVYNPNDALQLAVYTLLEQLDFDNNHRIFLSLDGEDLELVVTKISSIPYLWGPIVVRAEVWQ